MGGFESLDGRKCIWIENLFRWILALVFLAAGVPKVFQIYAFAEVIEAYGILPDALLLPAAVVLVTAEIIGAIGLLFRKRWALNLIFLLLMVFIIVLSYGLFMGLDIDCGCFMEGDPEYQAFSGLKKALLRDLLLLVPLAYLYLRPLIQNFFTRGEVT